MSQKRVVIVVCWGGGESGSRYFRLMIHSPTLDNDATSLNYDRLDYRYIPGSSSSVLNLVFLSN